MANNYYNGRGHNKIGIGRSGGSVGLKQGNGLGCLLAFPSVKCRTFSFHPSSALYILHTHNKTFPHPNIPSKLPSSLISPPSKMLFAFDSLIIIQMDSQVAREDKRGAQKARVKVAIRVRPFIEKEKNQTGCIDFRSDVEMVIGGDHSFKFDRVFREDSPQSAVYEECIRELVLNCFDGYNAAVLAYGQTGSGKTFTMGTAASNFSDLTSIGIIPRTVYEIFREVKERKEKNLIEVRASFIEIYNEQIIDLLSESHIKDMKHAIREEKDGSVTLTLVRDQVVNDADQMFSLLQLGSKNRTTASTLMNDASSRSHAIFTMTIKQSILADKEKQQEEGTITAKFYFVDLAGSERAKKTGATGSVLKEGININLSLLELGNVISALSTIQKNREQYISYRNSKLTRILQDCLGGNSNTYMIACVSPAESNYQESLSTLKYASKAMNIKNTPIVNRDEKTRLRQRIMELQEENRRLRTMLAEKGVRLEDLEPISMPQNNQELKKLREELKQINRKFAGVSEQLQIKSHKLNELQIKSSQMQRDKEVLQITLEDLIRDNPQLAESEATLSMKERMEQNIKDLPVLEKYMNQVQLLQQRLADRDSLFGELQIQYNKLMDFSKKEEAILLKKVRQLQQITRENQKLRDELKRVAQAKEISVDHSISVTENQEEIMMELEADKYDPLLQAEQKTFQEKEMMVRQEIMEMDKTIQQREKFLQKMSRENMKLGNQLVTSLNHNYHEKIVTLQRERKGLLKQKEEVSAAEKAKFNAKIEALEAELKDYKKKDKEQRKKEKLLESQSNQIRELSDQIKKLKVQKAALDRQFNSQRTNFNQQKAKRLKEIRAVKAQASQKDAIIRKLTIDNYKNVQFNRRKDQEIRKVKRLNEALKTIARPSKRTLQRNSLTQSANLDIQAHDQPSMQQEQFQVVERVKQQILLQIDRQNSLMRYDRAINENHQQLELLYADDSNYRVQLQRLNITEEQRQLNQDELATREELAMRIQQLKERIATCSDGLKYSQDHYTKILASKFQPFDFQAQFIYNPIYNSLQLQKVLIKVLFISIKNLLFQNNILVNKSGELQIDNKSLGEEIINLREQIIALNSEYCRNLSKAREEIMMNRFYNEEQEVQPNANVKRLDQRERRELERKIQDLSKNNRQITAELEKNRRKCQIVQEKYQSIKNLVSKDKNIGTQELPSFIKQDRRSLNQKQNSNKVMLEELDGMLDSIDKLKKVKSSTNLDEFQRDYRENRQEKITQNESINKWECMYKIEAHNSSVLSVAVHQSCLISSATKNIRLWDLQNKKLISDLTGPQLNGSVKYILVDPIRSLLFTACEKTVTMWDLVTLEVRGTLKSHKDQVRAIHIHGDYIFTGGKGTANGGSLLVSDLRKLSPNQCLQQKQKNQDIFTFTSHENILYYGTRNHSIRRMNIGNFDILSPFQPPHLDSVTGLTVSKGRLISGSKDKHLRLWSLDHTINNSKHTLHIFNDYVNTIHSPQGHPLIYAGSKDGQVKVCYTKNDKIQVLSGILTHTQSVNALATLYENPYGLVTASQDKTIKLWQPTKETLQNIARENYF